MAGSIRPSSGRLRKSSSSSSQRDERRVSVPYLFPFSLSAMPPHHPSLRDKKKYTYGRWSYSRSNILEAEDFLLSVSSSRELQEYEREREIGGRRIRRRRRKKNRQRTSQLPSIAEHGGLWDCVRVFSLCVCAAQSCLRERDSLSIGVCVCTRYLRVLRDGCDCEHPRSLRRY